MTDPTPRAADPDLFREQTEEREAIKAALLKEWEAQDAQREAERAEHLASFDRAAEHHRRVFEEAGGVAPPVAPSLEPPPPEAANRPTGPYEPPPTDQEAAHDTVEPHNESA
jgi:hypothetical protein